jgi:hypothetical protein
VTDNFSLREFAGKLRLRTDDLVGFTAARSRVSEIAGLCVIVQT